MKLKVSKDLMGKFKTKHVWLSEHFADLLKTFLTKPKILKGLPNVRCTYKEMIYSIIFFTVYMDDSEAKDLFQEVRIFCWILTTKSDIIHKAAAVNFTWAKRCNKHVYIASDEHTPPSSLPPAPPSPGVAQTGTGKFDFSTGTRKEYTAGNGLKFSTVSVDDVILIDSPDGWENLNEKTREVTQLIYMTEINNFDWFLKADDDTYVIMENLRFLLSTMDKNSPAYLGYQLEPPWYDWAYMSGGAGYVFSREGLRQLVQRGLNIKGACKDKGSFEDVEIGKCAEAAGVKVYSSLDKFERETFHPDRLQDFIPGPPQDWLFRYARNRPRGVSIRLAPKL